MSTLSSSDFIASWAARTQASADVYPAVAFDGRAALPKWLAESARDQAERVFLALDDTPVEARDLGMAEQIIRDAGMAFLEAWMLTMEAFGTGSELWAKDAAMAAGDAYRERLDDLAPGMHAGGRA